MPSGMGRGGASQRHRGRSLTLSMAKSHEPTEAGHTPPIAQALPPQPVPVEPTEAGTFARRLARGLLLAVVAAVVLFVLATTLWRR